MDNFLEVVNATVNPATQPVAVNLITEAAKLEGKKIRLHGKRLTICQQIAYSRMYAWSTCCTAETAHCVLGAGCTGLIEAPQRVVDGEVNKGIYQQNQTAAAAMQQEMPKVDSNVAAVVTYPLSKRLQGIEPDLVVIYVNTAQAMRFVQAFLYHDGGEFCMKSSGDAGVCSRAVAQVAMTDEPTIEIPCLGDRRFAMAQDHELCIGIPASWLERTAEGLQATHKAGIRYPIPFQIPAECDLPPAFITSESDY
ncbi:DUF169 domain-containing protein [Malonomonas rubra]|uniref:DUF169 domain-containing protein n=1 Tax=Malonomonas rubra TaxID=57040 RepID=UPI0026EB975A|nr:DUF169 domain-containing protein [Malonomonas rubra]